MKGETMDNKIEVKKKTDEELRQEFYNEYLELCKKHKMQIGVVPQFKLMTDTNTYSVVLQTIISPFNSI